MPSVVNTRLFPLKTTYQAISLQWRNKGCLRYNLHHRLLKDRWRRKQKYLNCYVKKLHCMRLLLRSSISLTCD
jgi:hypothetical protein